MQKTFGDSWARRDGTLEDSYPRLAVVGNISPAAAAWTWGNYVQQTAATTTDFVASYIDVALYGEIVAPTTTLGFNGELEYATGAAASEVAFATIPFASSVVMINNTDKTTSGIWATAMSVPIGPKYIPSGTRIAARIRTSQATANGSMRARPYLVGYDGGAAPTGVPTYTLRGQQTGIQKGQSYATDTTVAPPGAPTITLTSGAAAWGAWTQIVAATTGEWIILGIAGSQTPAVASKWGVIEIGTGGAGSEVTRARVFFPGYSYAWGGFHQMHRPLLIKPGERVAARMYSSAAYSLATQFLYELH